MAGQHFKRLVYEVLNLLEVLVTRLILALIIFKNLTDELMSW